MRLFLALPLPPDVAEAVAHATTPLREATPQLRWTPADKLHITVRFFGEQPEDLVPRAIAALTDAARPTPPLDLTLKGLGAFPTWTRARVVWAGVGYDPRLELLHHDLEVACMSLGLDVEGRPFRPHVTLTRLAPSGGEVARAIRLAARGVRVRAGWRCDHVALMQSTLGPASSTYRTLATIPLGSSR